MNVSVVKEGQGVGGRREGKERGGGAEGTGEGGGGKGEEIETPWGPRIWFK